MHGNKISEWQISTCDVATLWFIFIYSILDKEWGWWKCHLGEYPIDVLERNKCQSKSSSTARKSKLFAHFHYARQHYLYINIMKKSPLCEKVISIFRKQCSFLRTLVAPLPLEQMFIQFDWLQLPFHMTARLIRCLGVLWRLIKIQIKPPHLP